MPRPEPYASLQRLCVGPRARFAVHYVHRTGTAAGRLRASDDITIVIFVEIARRRARPGTVASRLAVEAETVAAVDRFGGAQQGHTGGRLGGAVFHLGHVARIGAAEHDIGRARWASFMSAITGPIRHSDIRG
jgi:hypothetical protein